MTIRKIPIKPEDNPSDTIYPETSYDQIILDEIPDQDWILGFKRGSNNCTLYSPSATGIIVQHNVKVKITTSTPPESITFGITFYNNDKSQYTTLEKILEILYNMSNNSSPITVCGSLSAPSGQYPLLYLIGNSADKATVYFLDRATSNMWGFDTIIIKNTMENVTEMALSDHVVINNIEMELN